MGNLLLLFVIGCLCQLGMIYLIDFLGDLVYLVRKMNKSR